MYTHKPPHLLRDIVPLKKKKIKSLCRVTSTVLEKEKIICALAHYILYT